MSQDQSDNGTTLVSMAEMMAELVLLGAATVADDDESQQFAVDTAKANPTWKPGEIPRAPSGYRNGVLARAKQHLQRNAGHQRQPIPAPKLVSSRPREGRTTRRRSGSSSSTSKSPSDPPEPDPPRGGCWLSKADWYRLDIEARLILGVEAVIGGDLDEGVQILHDLELDVSEFRQAREAA